MSKHTPGPWIADGRKVWTACPHHSNCSDYRHMSKVADIAYHAGSGWREEHANARLIAAAPDLLEALEAAIPAIVRPSHDSPTCSCGPCCVTRQARAAIAKARGEEQPR